MNAFLRRQKQRERNEELCKDLNNCQLFKLRDLRFNNTKKRQHLSSV